MEYGLLTALDVATLEMCLSELCKMFAGPLNVVEIGVQEGKTARGLKAWFDAQARELDYWGFDNQRDMPTPAPFDGAILIYGDSAETFRHLTSKVHLLIIDGCHCSNHVVLDFLNFSDRVHPGGLVLMHDTDRTMQGKPKHYQGHGPQGNPSFSVGVREGIAKLKIEHNASGWRLIADRAEPCDFGGFMAFQKLGGLVQLKRVWKGGAA